MSQSLADFILSGTSNVEQVSHTLSIPRPKHPKGWEPGVVWSGGGGVGVSKPREFDGSPVDHAELLQEWGFDPEAYEIEGPLEYRQWDAAIGAGEVRTMRYYKAKVVPRSFAPMASLDGLLKDIKSHKKLKKAAPTGEDAFVVALADWQLGKGLHDSLRMLTPSGWTTHGELRPGDYVYGPDGKPKEVLAVTGSSVKQGYEVRFDGRASLVTDGPHEWVVQRPYRIGDRKVSGKYMGGGRTEWRESRMTTAEIMGQPRSNQVRLPGVEYLQIDDRSDLEVEPYLLGAWLGDGISRAGTIVAAPKDGYIYTGYGCHRQPSSRPDLDQWSFPGLTAKLRNEGVLNNKHIPEKYLLAGEKQRLQLLQGLMDTDGTVTPLGIVQFDNTNETLVEGVALLAASFGWKTSRSQKQARLNGIDKKICYRVRFCPDVEVFTLRRKADRQNFQWQRNVKHRYIQDVVPIGEISAQCITVEGGVYLAGPDLIPTHNCDIGGTSEDTTRKILQMIDDVEDRIKELRKAGRTLGSLYVLGLGDMIERCSGFYANQAFVTDLTEAEQMELAVHLIVKAIKTWAPLFEQVVVAAVVGNHGENRKDGKANTDRVRDNADTAVFKTAALVLQENPDRYGHVSFMIPKDRSTLCLDIAGVTVGLAHGNQYTSAQGALKKWWEGQQLGYQPVADAHILITGHYHHLKVDQYGPRTHIQTPAMDPGSRWFSEGSGQESPSGTVTFVVQESKGWADLQVIGHE